MHKHLGHFHSATKKRTNLRLLNGSEKTKVEKINSST